MQPRHRTRGLRTNISDREALWVPDGREYPSVRGIRLLGLGTVCVDQVYYLGN